MIKKIPKGFTSKLRLENSDFNEFCKKHGNVGSSILKELVNGTFIAEIPELMSTTKEDTIYIDFCVFGTFSSLNDYLKDIENCFESELKKNNLNVDDIIEIQCDYSNYDIKLKYIRNESETEKNLRVKSLNFRKKLIEFMPEIQKFFKELYKNEIEQERLDNLSKKAKELEELEKRREELQKKIDSLKNGG